MICETPRAIPCDEHARCAQRGKRPHDIQPTRRRRGQTAVLIAARMSGDPHHGEGELVPAPERDGGPADDPDDDRADYRPATAVETRAMSCRDARGKREAA